MSEYLSEQGRKALENVADWLERGAPHVDKNGRVITTFDMTLSVCETSCGTSCCIAGAICQFENLGVLRGGDLDYSNAETLAIDYLGISEENAKRLFLPWSNVEFAHLDGMQYNARPFSDKAVAARTIRNFIGTGEIDWIAAGLDMSEDEDDE